MMMMFVVEYPGVPAGFGVPSESPSAMSSSR